MKEPSRDLDQLAHLVIGAAIEVHRELGPGFLESVYERALSCELTERNVPHVCQAPIQIRYKGQDVGEGRLDMLIDKRLVVELKAIERFEAIHQAQLISYLKATQCFLGLLINFNVPILKQGIRRVVLS
jgi:GxxExxY protein